MPLITKKRIDMKKIEDMNTRELTCIIGEEARCAFATREELGKSIQYAFRMINNVAKKNKNR